MIERKDLTRWNRAGLSRFRYVDGKAAEYLEMLRQQLVKRFVDPKAGKSTWLKPAEEIRANEKKPEAETETLIQRQERLSRTQERILKMYKQDRRDWAWEITRTFARACHILTEHTDAYANEGYLGTATQWDNVRRLVEMLDYHPAPPASASTRLAFIAKEIKTEKQNETGKDNKKDKKNKTGIVAKGFQVKYSPPSGGDKIIFETLEDLLIDPALNALRPKGWNQSEKPAALSPDDNEATSSPVKVSQYSSIANGSVIHLKGAGENWSRKLNTLLGYSDPNYCRIEDLLNVDPEEPSIVLDREDLGEDVAVRLRELKAKALEICNFRLESDWSDISGKSLPNIASESPDSLVEITGNSLDKVKALQQRIELIGAFLDHRVYEQTKLEDLVAPVAAAAVETVITSWRAKRKPKVSPGQIAMIYREYRDEETGKYIDEAEAATISIIEKQTEIIHITPSAVQTQKTWLDWKKGEARLMVSPRWQRKCWLNGTNVIRTTEPHGLTAGTFIGWNSDWNTTNVWDYSKIEYAEIIEVDKRHLRLKYGYNLHLMRVDNTADLVDKGRSLVIVALIDAKLHIRIFDAGGDRIVNKTEELLSDRALRTVKQQLNPFPNESDLSQEDKQNIIENAASCAGYALLPEEHTAIIELLPIDGSILSADYEEIVLLDNKGEPDQRGGVLEDVVPTIDESPFASIFEIDDTVAGTSSGGGLLPPAALPKIGSFLFPSPMLPMDLVKAAVELMLSLGVMQIPSSGEIVIKGVPFTGVLGELVNKLPVESSGMNALAGALYKFLDEMVKVDEDGNDVPTEKLINWLVTPCDDAILELQDVLSQAEGKPSALFQQILEEIEQEGPLLATPKHPPIKAVVDSADPRYVVEGNANKIVIGDWLVGQFTDGPTALKIRSVDQFSEESFSLKFEMLVGNEGELQKLYADFRGELIAEGASVNNTEVDPDNLELEEVPESLKTGSEVLLTAEGKKPVAAKIESIVGNTIKTNPSAEGFTKGDLTILGNVVLAGHGERKPEKILGSGDAAKSNQDFRLEVEKVSFTPDATKSSGVAAAIEVKVDGRIWEQVSTLKDSGPGDHQYAIRMTEEGYVKILFGDGEHGRRLPSGKNNIRVRYRVGSGLSGNVPAGELEKPVNPHPLIKAVLQPLHAAGGGDMEDMASLRENAPSTLLALERAVSLSDFSHLAAAQSSIWQAKAYSPILHEGRMESVKVVIVPADGVTSEEIEGDIEDFLQKHALPGVQVTVDHFESVLFDLSVKVRVKTNEFIAEEVEKAVMTALKDHFTLQNRKLGQPLYLSEVYKVVERVKGVENSICEIFAQSLESDVPEEKKALQVIKAGDESTVVYLDTDAIDADKKPSKLIVTHEEYKP